ncbi:hypothetical protein NDU88_001161 [Pleurodeles waltl]|uniref:Uncharacterized protein n=1 Tax=Pleurodeles waltl TaxID=8319 RepID=A0AAV7NDG3_PLEWA|nr:hypothetical protein NDU88_001161 [Pleurodeles waltl]
MCTVCEQQSTQASCTVRETKRRCSCAPKPRNLIPCNEDAQMWKRASDQSRKQPMYRRDTRRSKLGRLGGRDSHWLGSSFGRIKKEIRDPFI